MKKFDSGKIDFMGYSKAGAILSLILVVASFFFIFTKGFNFGIDFAGGSEIQIGFEKATTVEQVKDAFKKNGYEQVMVQKFQDSNDLLVRINTTETDDSLVKKSADGTEAVAGFAWVKTEFPGSKLLRVDSVGPQIGSELKRNGLLAILYSLIFILIYIWIRFDTVYAPGAVICLFHDSVITLGVFAALGKEVNVQTLAAVLTIIGYSLNDTIVNYDRIRENFMKFKKVPLPQVINRAINDVLTRTILTSVTTMIAVIALYFAGGVIRDLAFTLGIGVIVGTYSSIFVASPLVTVFTDLFNSLATASEKKVASKKTVTT